MNRLEGIIGNFPLNQANLSSPSEKKRNLEAASEGVGKYKKRRTSDYSNTFTTLRNLAKILEEKIVVDDAYETIRDYFRGKFFFRILCDDEVFNVFSDPNKRKAIYDAMDMHAAKTYSSSIHPLENLVSFYLFVKTGACPVKNVTHVLFGICQLEKENQVVLTRRLVTEFFQDLKVAQNFLRPLTSDSVDDLLADVAYLTTQVEANLKTLQIMDETTHFLPKNNKLDLDRKLMSSAIQLIEIFEASWKNNDQNSTPDVLKQRFPNTNELLNALQRLLHIIDITGKAAEAYKEELERVRD